VKLLIPLVVLGVPAALMLRQHLRYWRARRDPVQDRQSLFYPSASLHVLTFLELEPRGDVIESVRALRRETETLEGARWIYAGKAAANARSSAQLGEVDWGAVVLVQYPSEDSYRKAASSARYRAALARFPRSYSHGFWRPLALNLLLHQLFLARRIVQLVTRAPSHFPFEPAPAGELSSETPLLEKVTEKLLAERALGARAAVVVNLTRPGTPEQQASDRRYVGKMMGAMAEGGYGPMHIGRAVTLEGSARFDNVAIVYYPGVEFFAAMARSRFFQAIIGSKQLGDAQSTITVPILARL
jgi:uncharacterized protein (DUF1330 family)